MEIKLNIPANDYVQPTEIRPEIVQGICEAFLHDCAWSTFHPFADSVYRRKTDCIYRNKRSKSFTGFRNFDDMWKEDVFFRFNGAEMRAAFKALIAAGYYMFRIYKYGSWMGYKCSKRPFMENGRKVTEFTDFID